MSTTDRGARVDRPGASDRAAAARPASPARPRRPGPLVPDQHGAWAFLALPVFLAAPALSWHPALVPVVLAWVAAYPAAWALTGRLTARRPHRFDRALRLWLPLAGVAAAASVAWRPWLVWVGVLYGLGYAVSLTYARARRERALGNDLVLVAQCALMVPVLVGVGARGGWVPPWPTFDRTLALLTAVCALALVGSTLHVKSLIRERRRPGFARASRWFSLACLAAATGLAVTGTPWPLMPATLAALRTHLLRDPSLRPGRIGMVELGVLVVLAGSAWRA